MLDYGRDLCNTLSIATDREWLVTNGLGGYAMGTVWGWLIGPFVSAHLRLHKNHDQARSFLVPMLQHLDGHCIGSMSEIFDGDPPFTPRGCIAQAWTVAEVLRAWGEVEGGE